MLWDSWGWLGAESGSPFVPLCVHSPSNHAVSLAFQLAGAGGDWPWEGGHPAGGSRGVTGSVSGPLWRDRITWISMRRSDFTLPKCRTDCPVFLLKTLQWLIFAPELESGLFFPILLL